MKFDCENCGKKVDTEKDKYVMVETGFGHKIIDQAYFHFDCWIEYFNKCVSNKLNSVGRKAIRMLGNVVERMKYE